MITIQLDAQSYECCICGCETMDRYAVAYCCGPTHDEIGAPSSEYRDTIVGGAPVCKACHDKHYGITPDGGA